MDESQADAIARAILQPDVRMKEELARKRAADAARTAQSRAMAWAAIIGAGVGGVTAYAAGLGLLQGVLWGSMAGAALGRLWAWSRSWSRAV